MAGSIRAAAAAVALCLVVAASGCGTSDPEVSSASGGDGSKEATTTVAPSTEGEDEEPAPETTTTAAPAGASIEVAETGFSVYTAYDDSKEATAAAVLKNEGDETAEYFEVVFSFKDAAGKPVGTETATVYGVAAGEAGYAQVSMVELTGDPTAVEATAVVDGDSFIDVATLPVTVEGVVPEEYGDGSEVKGIVKNDTEEVYEYFSVTCVLRSAGKIVGGASGTLDTLVPGGEITWSATGPVKADAAECAASGSI
jgi:hypothetical protein